MHNPILSAKQFATIDMIQKADLLSVLVLVEEKKTIRLLVQIGLKEDGPYFLKK